MTGQKANTGKRNLFSNDFRFKLKKFITEVITIVFSVSLSIWFYEMNDQRNKQNDVKKFLLGLKIDLECDINEMEADKTMFKKRQLAFKFITSVKFNSRLNTDSLKYHLQYIYGTTGLVPNNGRFEGFKSSGKIGDIENNVLQNDIMDLYQEDIANLLGSTKSYNLRKQELYDFLNKNLKKKSDSTTNIDAVIITDEAQNICLSLNYADEIIGRYDVCINKSKKIIGEIKKEYDL